MLIGDAYHSIDAKGRYIVPAKFREELGENLVVSKGLEHCLYVYTAAAWQTTTARITAELPSNDQQTRKFFRIFFAGAHELDLDKQFRILLPPALREYAGLNKDIVTIGMSSHLEIWDKDAWARYSKEADSEYESIAAGLHGFFL